MLKAYKTALYFVLAVLTIGIVHSGTTAASSFSHLENKPTAQNSSSCQPVCHGSPAANRAKLVDIKRDEREPFPPKVLFNDSTFLTTIESILTDRQIWRLASWTPPDQLLMSSAFTTSL